MTLLAYYRQHNRPVRCPKVILPGKRKRRVFAVEDEQREIDFRDLSFDFERKKKQQKAKRKKRLMLAVAKLMEDGVL